MPPRDDLGQPVPAARPARRVVSLVPSLTESVAVTRPGALAGATIWCTHPGDLDVPRVRGTKNPDLAAIAALKPDLVLANQEENRRVDVERLRAAGIGVWVTVIRTLDEAFASLRRMFTDGLGWPEPPWLAAAERTWREPAPGPFRLASAERVRELLERAGFAEITVEALDLSRRHSSFQEMWDATLDLSRSFHDAVLSQPPAELEQIKRSLGERFAPYTAADGTLEIPGRTLLAAASA